MFTIKNTVDDLVDNSISIVEQIFEPELLQLLFDEILEIEAEDDLQNAKIGRLDQNILYQKIRSDKIKWLEGNTKAQKLLFEKLENIRIELNKNLMLGLFDFETHFAVYKNGDFYKKHFDSFRGDKNRIISMVIYLNKNWQESDGGVLNIYKNIEDLKPEFSVAPKWGNAVFFLSEEVPHEVAISNKTRYSIAVWFRVRDII